MKGDGGGVRGLVLGDGICGEGSRGVSTGVVLGEAAAVLDGGGEGDGVGVTSLVGNGEEGADDLGFGDSSTEDVEGGSGDRFGEGYEGFRVGGGGVCGGVVARRGGGLTGDGGDAVARGGICSGGVGDAGSGGGGGGGWGGGGAGCAGGGGGGGCSG